MVIVFCLVESCFQSMTVELISGWQVVKAFELELITVWRWFTGFGAPQHLQVTGFVGTLSDFSDGDGRRSSIRAHRQFVGALPGAIV